MRYRVTLDHTEIEVDVEGDETDALRVAREVLGWSSDCRVQSAILVDQGVTLHPGDPPADPTAPNKFVEAQAIRAYLEANPESTNKAVVEALNANGVRVKSSQVTEVRAKLMGEHS